MNGREIGVVRDLLEAVTMLASTVDQLNQWAPGGVSNGTALARKRLGAARKTLDAMQGYDKPPISESVCRDCGCVGGHHRSCHGYPTGKA